MEAKGGAKSRTIKAIFDGLDPEGKPMMQETRTITFHTGPDPRIIDRSQYSRPAPSSAIRKKAPLGSPWPRC